MVKKSNDNHQGVNHKGTFNIHEAKICQDYHLNAKLPYKNKKQREFASIFVNPSNDSPI